MARSPDPSSPSLEGGCLCGAVRYQISAEPRDAGYCHCRMCQRSTGAPVAPWLTVASVAFAWISGEPAVYRSSAKAERLFCPTCGTQLVFRALAEPGELDVTLVSLDNPATVRPSHHIWTASKISWFDTAALLGARSGRLKLRC
ncbi:MAG TPA: GFA family protein [Geminicoccaceae bacterium]|nr:GFA family protein [Geminicoccaceae bacterium]